MNKIPTADEFIKDRYDWSEDDLERWAEKMQKLPMANFDNVIDLMDSYSKLKAEYYVEEALKAAAENARAEMCLELNGDEYPIVDKESILKAYPKENIL